MSTLANTTDAGDTDRPPVVQLPWSDRDSVGHLTSTSSSEISRLKSAIDRLDDAYRQQFDKDGEHAAAGRAGRPSFYVRSPGRVNLIGEHIDYCGYAVLPMAIEQCILMAVGSADDDDDDDDDDDAKGGDHSSTISMLNTDPKYKPFVCQLANVKVDGTAPRWHDYVLSGFLGIKEHLKLALPRGMRLVVDGSVPPSAGLSSSSALVCASAMATVHINGHSIPKFDMGTICAKSERYVGIEGGGMDQAICFLGEAGKAKLIEFNPLRATDVALPKGHVFVIANSLSDMNKASTSQYNTRVVECRLATKVLAKLIECRSEKELRLLSELQTLLEVDAGEMANRVRQLLHEEPYDRDEVCELLGVTDDQLATTCLNQNTLHLQEFKLRQRALHVYTESQRVIDFKKVCDAVAAGSADESAEAARKLGALMNESHASCRDLYECSHPDLDELVGVARLSGALGSRLTGAGWGGCTVSLIRESDVDFFLAQVRLLYYGANEERHERMGTSLFPTAPASGATVYKVAAAATASPKRNA